MSDTTDDHRHRDTSTPDTGHTTHNPVVDGDSIHGHAAAYLAEQDHNGIYP